jgi:hypothetical protein
LRPAPATTRGVPQVLRAVSGMKGPGTGAALLTAFSEVHRDSSGAEVAEALQLLVQGSSFLFESFEDSGHDFPPYLNVITAFRL